MSENKPKKTDLHIDMKFQNAELPKLITKDEKFKGFAGVLEQAKTYRERILELNTRPFGKLVTYEAFEKMKEQVALEKTVSAESVKQVLSQVKDLIDDIPIDMQKVGRTYEVYSIGTKKQWIDWFIRFNQVLGLNKEKNDSPSHRLLRTCCPRQYDKNEENSIYKEFQRHDKWLELASKCKESWQEFQGIPSPLPSCKITKDVCDYERCPKNVWRKETKK